MVNLDLSSSQPLSLKTGTGCISQMDGIQPIELVVGLCEVMSMRCRSIKTGEVLNMSLAAVLECYDIEPLISLGGDICRIVKRSVPAAVAR